MSHMHKAVKRKVKPEFLDNDLVNLDAFIKDLQDNMKIDGSTEKKTYQTILDPYVKKFDPDIYAILEGEGEFYVKQGDIEIFKKRAYDRILTPDLSKTLASERGKHKDLAYKALAVAAILVAGFWGYQAIQRNRANTKENIESEIQDNGSNFFYLIDGSTQQRLIEIIKRLGNNGNEYELEKDSTKLLMGQNIIKYIKPQGTYHIFWKQSVLTENTSYFINLEYKTPNEVKIDLKANEYNQKLQKVLEEIETIRANDLPN